MQNRMLFIPREEVLELLKQAFEEGWNGFYELKDNTSEMLLDDYLEKRRGKNIHEGQVPVEPAFSLEEPMGGPPVVELVPMNAWPAETGVQFATLDSTGSTSEFSGWTVEAEYRPAGPRTAVNSTSNAERQSVSPTEYTATFIPANS